jgi:riboflavin synthase
MFTGIIEQKGIVTEVKIHGTNRTFRISSPISAELKIDQSLSHDGVCLTIEAIENDFHQVTAIFETLQKTTLRNWDTGTVINLERCMQLNGRLDGHIVQGHVDTTAVCTAATEKEGSWEFEFKVDNSFGNQIIEKGSIAINGISLTLFDVGLNSFKVAIIPFTYNHTNLSFLKPGNEVNIEFDIIGKYVNRIHHLSKH